MLGRPNLCAREWITRQYDHEVQAGSVLKPLVGREAPVPGDAAVIRPRPESPRGLALSLALNPAYSQIDTYHMTAVTIDEAVRRLLAVGGRLWTISPEWTTSAGPAWSTTRSATRTANTRRRNWCGPAGPSRTCAGLMSIPLLSGKDSMYVDGVLPGAFGEMHRV